MKVLFIKERTHKLDVMENAVLKTFSQCEDVVTIATIKVGGVLNTVSQIKKLIKQYQPDVIVAKHLLASVLLFELPKTIKKILIDPFLVFEDSEDGIKLTLAFNYGSVKLFNWLLKNSIEYANNPDNARVRNSYCILHNADTSSSQYAKWVSAFEEANNLGVVTVSKADNIMTQLSTCHRSMNQARAYLDSEYELINISELINGESRKSDEE
ncbi:MAG: hypothetical protein E7075_05380 [Bacteroidales bacterium]|nr:hypothetical protein [Bacteroidales bacterium]